MTKVQLSYGIRDGVPVPITAITPESNGNKCDCVCPACGKALQARTLGKKRAAHFAHKAASNCQPETIQHQTAKFLLQWRIKSAITDGKPLLLNWCCESCAKNFSMDITKSVESVEVEKGIASIRPDVVTIDHEGNPVALIEVVFENHPSDEKVQFAKERQFNLIEFNIKADPETALKTLETSEVLSPSRVRPCHSEYCALNDFSDTQKPPTKDSPLSSDPHCLREGETEETSSGWLPVVVGVLFAGCVLRAGWKSLSKWLR